MIANKDADRCGRGFSADALDSFGLDSVGAEALLQPHTGLTVYHSPLRYNPFVPETLARNYRITPCPKSLCVPNPSSC